MAFFLIIGMGSIGTRHLNNLVKAGYTDIVTVTRTPLTDNGLPAFPNYQNLEDALDAHAVTHAIVCTPTAVHVSALLTLVRRTVPNIYLEKPIAHSLESLDCLAPYLPYSGRLVIGYDLHFDPGILKVKQWLGEGRIGRLLSLHAFVGQHLSQWRPYEDYRKGMSASVEKGGGVLLDLVHEFDYVRWLVGRPERLSSVIQHNPEMQIQTEDVADILVVFQNGISATFHFDYHQPSLARYCRFTGTDGSIVLDLAHRIARLEGSGGIQEFEYTAFERNDRFQAIMAAFVNTEEFDQRLTGYDDALISLQMVEAAKESNRTKQFIHLT